MTEQSQPSAMSKTIILNARFEAYLALVADINRASGPRIAYDGELLELMSPSKDDERYNRLLEGLVTLLGDEWDLEIIGTGSLTLQAEPRGAEPDSSFYVSNALSGSAADVMRESDPPPDIVVEIDMSRARIDKRSIYAALGVPEFWRFDGRTLRVYTFVSSEYVEVADSVALNGLSMAQLAEFLAMRTTVPPSRIRQAWQRWLRANKPDGGG